MNHRNGADPPTRIVWQPMHQPGAEWCSVECGPNGSTIAGVAVLAHSGHAQRFDYELELDAAAVTRRAQITAVLPERTEVFDIATDAAGSWWRSGKLILEDPDALDVDLGFSPGTTSATGRGWPAPDRPRPPAERWPVCSAASGGGP